MIIGIDVDETVVDSRVPIKSSQDLIDLFHNSTLYDNLEPLPGAVETINELSIKNTIIFISKCFPPHRASKINFLNKYFNFHGFIDSSLFGTKDLLGIDFLIDDNDKELEKIPEYKRIKFTNWGDIRAKFKI